MVFGGLTLGAARVLAIRVALADLSISSVDEEFDLVPPSELPRGLASFGLRSMRRSGA